MPDARDILFSALSPDVDAAARAKAYADQLMPPVQPLDDASPSTFGRISRGLRDFREAISPSNVFSPSDIASFAPGGGLVNAWHDSGKGMQSLKSGDYGGAASNYGNMLLNMVPEGAALGKLAALPFLAKAAGGKVNLGAVMRDVDLGALNRMPKEDMRAFNRAVDAQEWTEATVPIRSLYATQPYANADFAEAAAKRAGDGMDLPLVVRAPDGKMYVRDGHHRLTALADQDAQTANVRLIDLMKRLGHPELPFGGQ